MNNLTELSKRVYQLQIEKGWCKLDEKRDIEDLKVLILSEAFEAFKAYRKGKYCNHPNLFTLKEEFFMLQEELKSSPDLLIHNAEVISDFKESVKDTFEDEIADVAIRALDLAGYLGLNFGGASVQDITTYRVISDKKHFPKVLIQFTGLMSSYSCIEPIEANVNSWIHFRGSSKVIDNSFIYYILNWCKEIAYKFDFDLMQHVELKLAYNKTRPFRHGGKVV